MQDVTGDGMDRDDIEFAVVATLWAWSDLDVLANEVALSFQILGGEAFEVVHQRGDTVLDLPADHRHAAPLTATGCTGVGTETHARALFSMGMGRME